MLEIPLPTIQASLKESMISVIDADGAGTSMRLRQGPSLVPTYIAITNFQTEGLESIIEAHLPAVSGLQSLLIKIKLKCA